MSMIDATTDEVREAADGGLRDDSRGDVRGEARRDAGEAVTWQELAIAVVVMAILGVLLHLWRN